MDIGDPIKTTVEEIGKVLNIKNVVGEPIETDDFTLIPITKRGMGFGVGMGEGKDEKGKGAGASGGAGIEPIAMVMISKDVLGNDGVKIMSFKTPDLLTRAISEIGNAAVKIMDKDQEMIKEIYMKKIAKKREANELKK